MCPCTDAATPGTSPVRHTCLQRKRQGLLEAWRRERAQFLEDTAALLKEATQLAVERAETAADR